MRLHYAARSDVGRVRKDNQDSGYAGPYLLAIADGVGGAARGDIASAATIEVLRKLDEPHARTDGGGPDEMLSALAGAIHRSHDRLRELVAEFPEIDGTSSTATAVAFDGDVMALAHVGDSRGYLLREGALSQLTTDHTFVQSLIDEGRITEDEARVHPHRNLILRAVDGVHEPEPDVFTIEAVAGDRLLLCSDGCSGALSPDRLATVLGQGTPPEAAEALVRAALEAGSTDNVTVVVADVADGDPARAEPGAALVVGSAADTPARPVVADPSLTGELPLIGEESSDDVDPEEARYAPRAPRRHLWARRLLGLALVVGLLVVVGIGGYRWSQDQYYVSSNGDSVAIFQGIEADIPGVSLQRVEEDTAYLLADLPSYRQRQVRDGITASSLADARAVVDGLRSDVDCPPSVTPTPTARATRKPTAKPGATPRPTAKPRPTPAPSPSPSPSATRTPAVCLSASPSP